MVCTGVKEMSLADPVKESLSHVPLNVFIGDKYHCFSKMLNELIYIALKNGSSNFIFCSHRVRPTPNDVNRMISLIKEGYGLVAFYRMAFFGFNLELIKRIGLFDERYTPCGGYEDDDFFLRLQEANISVYYDKSVEYHNGPSLWSQELFKFPGVEFKQPITFKFFNKKWLKKTDEMSFTRMVPEQYMCYDLGTSDKTINFKPWNESDLGELEMQNRFKIISLNEITSKKILIILLDKS